jgi:F420-non-reducing hydrogenase large subunit
MSVKKAAENLIKPGRDIPESLLNQIEMAWRPYDPCMSCSTHSLPGAMPLDITVLDAGGNTVRRLTR